MQASLQDISLVLGEVAIFRGLPAAVSAEIARSVQILSLPKGARVYACGHGIGANFHEDPQVLHYGKPGTGIELKPGMIFTIEPMINAGKAAISELPDGWTIVTKDRSLSAQWEHTVVVTDTGVEVLTLSEKAPQPPALVAAQFA